MTVLSHGKPGETYNVGSGHELTNLEMVSAVCSAMGTQEDVAFIKDRPGHDFRYSVDCSKLKALGWETKGSFAQDMRDSVEWYRRNPWQGL